MSQGDITVEEMYCPLFSEGFKMYRIIFFIFPFFCYAVNYYHDDLKIVILNELFQRDELIYSYYLESNDQLQKTFYLGCLFENEKLRNWIYTLAYKSSTEVSD
jgi:hypothetical protein